MKTQTSSHLLYLNKHSCSCFRAYIKNPEVQSLTPTLTLLAVLPQLILPYKTYEQGYLGARLHCVSLAVTSVKDSNISTFSYLQYPMYSTSSRHIACLYFLNHSSTDNVVYSVYSIKYCNKSLGHRTELTDIGNHTIFCRQELLGTFSMYDGDMTTTVKINASNKSSKYNFMYNDQLHEFNRP